MEWNLINMFSTPKFFRKINNANYKRYIHDKLIKELNSRDKHCAEAIPDSYEFKRLKE